MANTQTEQNQPQVKRIDILPDEVLLGIFDFYMNMHTLYGFKKDTEAWQTLVHVCRRWRNLVLASPRRLNLQLRCTPKTPAKDKLDVWPPLPLIIGDVLYPTSVTENIVAALGHSKRVRGVELHTTRREMEKALAVMKVSFPELRRIQFMSALGAPPVIPDSFLGGSAPPSLQHFELYGIPFPVLPNFLLSATHLAFLSLSGIPDSGYISPETMVDLLSVLSSLRRFSLGFPYPKSIPSWKNQSPRKHFILPALEDFHFVGDLEYLEELVAHIDAPQLVGMHITFFSLTDIDCPRLAQFINCTPRFKACDEAHVQFTNDAIGLELRYRSSLPGSHNVLIQILSIDPDQQLSLIGQVCNGVLRPFSTVEDLYIEHRDWEPVRGGHGIKNTVWLQLLLPFTVAKNLYLSMESAPRITELLEGRITEVLPSLQNIFLDEIEQRLKFNVGDSITISVWDKESQWM